MFVPGTVEEVIVRDAPPEVYPNRFLAEAMVNFNLIDTIGSGITLAGCEDPLEWCALCLRSYSPDASGRPEFRLCLVEPMTLLWGGFVRGGSG